MTKTAKKNRKKSVVSETTKQYEERDSFCEVSRSGEHFWCECPGKQACSCGDTICVDCNVRMKK